MPVWIHFVLICWYKLTSGGLAYKALC